MITGINDSKTWAKHIYSSLLNVNLMEQNLIRINGGIMISVDVTVKKFLEL